MTTMTRFTAIATTALTITAFSMTAPGHASGDLRSKTMALASICRSDYDRLCSGTQPGGGRILACLSAHAADLTPPCAAAMPQARVLRDKAAGTGQ